MAWTQQDLDDFDEAFKNRANTATLELVYPSGQSVRFDSLLSMRQHRNMIVGEINKSNRSGGMQASLASFC